MKEEKADEKEKKGGETGSAAGAEAGTDTGSSAGAETGAKAKSEKADKTVKVKFRNAYIGRLGHYSAGKEYDLTKELYELFKADCEVLK